MTVELALDGPVARIIFDLVATKGGVRPEDLEALDHAASKACASDAVRVITLSAAPAGGEFGRGGDLRSFAAAQDRVPELLRTMVGHLQSALATMHASDKIIVSAVSGAISGGSMGIMLCSDLIIAADSARFSLGFPRIGGVPDTGTTWMLPRRVGWQKSVQMLLLNEELSAQAALDAGLVAKVVPTADLGRSLDQVVETLLALNPEAAKATKRLMHQSLQSSYADHFVAEVDAFAQVASQPEFRRRLAAFLAPRPGKSG